MLMVCTACAAEGSWDVFKASSPPAGAIFAKVRSFRAPTCTLLLPSGSEVVLVVVAASEVTGVVVGDTGSCN